MFELSEETKVNIIAVLRDRLPVDTVSDQDLKETIDEVVKVVKSQFGF
jgi:hypothetical protein